MNNLKEICKYLQVISYKSITTDTINKKQFHIIQY